ncbi:MAG TPA: hypothetical protein VN920_04855, partial [Pyrinomonadaceae bacterium]|nr:hypothetical protein [Pyrinomonadaceae bacterium]
CRAEDLRELQSLLEGFVDEALSEVFLAGEVSFLSDFSPPAELVDSPLSLADAPASPAAADLSCDLFSLAALLA